MHYTHFILAASAVASALADGSSSNMEKRARRPAKVAAKGAARAANPWAGTSTLQVKGNTGVSAMQLVRFLFLPLQLVRHAYACLIDRRR